MEDLDPIAAQLLNSEKVLVELPRGLLEQILSSANKRDTSTLEIGPANGDDNSSNGEGGKPNRVIVVDRYKVETEGFNFPLPDQIIVYSSSDMHQKDHTSNINFRYRTLVDKVYSRLSEIPTLGVVRKREDLPGTVTETVNYPTLTETLRHDVLNDELKSLLLKEVNQRRIRINDKINEILIPDERKFLQKYQAEKLYQSFSHLQEVNSEEVENNYQAFRFMKALGVYNKDLLADLKTIFAFDKRRDYQMVTADSICDNWLVNEKAILEKAKNGVFNFSDDDIIRIDLDRLVTGVEQQDYALFSLTAKEAYSNFNYSLNEDTPIASQLEDENAEYFSKQGSDEKKRSKPQQGFFPEDKRKYAYRESPYQIGLTRAELFEFTRLIDVYLTKCTKDRQAENLQKAKKMIVMDTIENISEGLSAHLWNTPLEGEFSSFQINKAREFGKRIKHFLYERTQEIQANKDSDYATENKVKAINYSSIFASKY